MAIDIDAQRELLPELDRSEQLVWAGRPATGILFRRGDIFLIPFTLVWCGFAIVWEIGAAASGAPLYFLLFGAIFVVIGIFLVAGRFWFDAFKRRRTVYGMTNERVLIKSDLFRREVKSHFIRALQETSLSERRNGKGTIRLGPDVPFGGWYRGLAWPGINAAAPALEEISDARQVYDQLRELQRKS